MHYRILIHFIKVLTKLSVFAFLHCCFNFAFAQNLIINPGFEGNESGKPSMRPWQTINTIDYFIYKESKTEQKIRIRPARFLGMSLFNRSIVYIYDLRPARSGVAYTGMRMWIGHSEYLVAELSEPLERDKNYLFEMYILSSPNTNSYIMELGVSAYPDIPPYNQKDAVLAYPPQVRIFKPDGFSETKEWTIIRGVFTAEGGEKHLIIGNFVLNEKERFRRKKSGLKQKEAYYFIDDVGLFKLDEKGWPMRGDE